MKVGGKLRKHGMNSRKGCFDVKLRKKTAETMGRMKHAKEGFGSEMEERLRWGGGWVDYGGGVLIKHGIENGSNVMGWRQGMTTSDDGDVDDGEAKLVDSKQDVGRVQKTNKWWCLGWWRPQKAGREREGEGGNGGGDDDRYGNKGQKRWHTEARVPTAAAVQQQVWLVM